MNLNDIIYRLGQEIDDHIDGLNQELYDHVEENENGRKILKNEWWSIYSFMDSRHSYPRPNPFPITPKYVYLVWRYYMQESKRKIYKVVHPCPDIKMESLIKLITFFELKIELTDAN